MLTVAEKTETMGKITQAMGLDVKDTGSPEVQIALLTQQIVRLTDHLKKNKQDFHSRYGLMKLVSQRRRLMKYLRNSDTARYQKMLAVLQLRG